MHYYGKFLPNLSPWLHPLNRLLKSNVQWKWSTKCQKAFEHAKSQLASAPVLAIYDAERQIKLAADASAYGLAQKVATATQRDPLLSQIYRYTQLGWPTEVDSVFVCHFGIVKLNCLWKQIAYCGVYES